MNSVIKILIVEDMPALLPVLRELLEKEEDFRIVGCSSKEEETLPLVCETDPDIVLVDLHSEAFSSDGIRLSRKLRIETDVRTLVLLEDCEPELTVKAFREGFASDCVFRNQLSLLPAAIRISAQGHTAQEYISMFLAIDYLSRAEKTVFWIMMGKENTLLSASKTIANQKRRVVKKLGLKNQKELKHVFQVLQDEQQEDV